MGGDGWQVVMGQLSTEEKKKRGCIYCADARKVRGYRSCELYVKAHLTCPHDICPYSELDKFEKYIDYLQSDESKFEFLEMPKAFNF